MIAILLRMLFGKGKIKKGQIYVFDDEKYESPFLEDKEKHLVEVLDVSGDWVLYRFINSDIRPKESQKKGYFLSCYKLYKEAKGD